MDGTVEQSSCHVGSAIRFVDAAFIDFTFPWGVEPLHTCHISPCCKFLKIMLCTLVAQFRDLVRAALKGGIFVAVVTFSIQTDLIVDALKHVFPKCCKKIPVFGNDERWACSSAMMTKFYKRKGTRLVGKLPHMCAAAAASVKKKCIKPITFSDVLLIDDDKNNIKTARGQGVRACWLWVSPHLHTYIYGPLMCWCLVLILFRYVFHDVCNKIIRWFAQTGAKTLRMLSFGTWNVSRDPKQQNNKLLLQTQSSAWQFRIND